MNPPARYSACIKAFLAGIIKKYGSYLYYSFRTDVANNPDFDTVTPSWKSGVSLMPKWGQVDRAWGQIVNYVNHMGSKNPAGACPAGLLFFVYLVAGLLDHSE